MPILAPETSFFPECLLDALPESDTDRSWRALHTKPRQEKSIARELLHSEIPFYLPLVPRTNLVRGRQVHSHVPLFTSYVFLFGTDDERVESLKTNRVVHAIDVADGERLRSDLRQVQQLIESGEPLTVESRLKPGRRVRIRTGSMAGMEGTVLDRRRKVKLLVAVQFINQGVSVELDDFQLEPID